MCVSASLFLLSWQEDLGLNGYCSYYYCFTLYHNQGLVCITRWYCPTELKPGQVFRSSGKVAQGYSSRKGRSPSYLPSINSIFLICMTEYCVKIDLQHPSVPLHGAHLSGRGPGLPAAPTGALLWHHFTHGAADV